MKRVSFKVAKSLKEAGYSQGHTAMCYDINGVQYDRCCSNTFADAPFTFEVWLWLWREKSISIDWKDGYVYVNGDEIGCFTDPEEAISEGVEYIVDNDLLK